jgi:hypothetical protein
MAAFRIDPFDAFECRRKHSGWRLSFAKTGAALLSVGIANVTRSHHHGDRDGWQAWRSNVGAFGHASAAPDAHSAADEVTSGCASFVTVVEAADFRECDDVAFADVLHASRHRRVLR